MTHTIAIIGAGFSGTIMAARLLRAAAGAPLKVVLINRSNAVGGLARGLAYGTRSDHHLLNVPAGRMSAFPENENDFVHFLQTAGLAAEGGSFVPRRWYGEYLADTLKKAVSERAAGNEYEVRSGEVVTIATAGAEARLQLSDGSSVMADAVVLALGNFAPANLPLRDASCFDSARYVRDPWAAGALDRIDHGKPVLLIGTGLTMFDVVMSLEARHPGGRYLALSRRGLLPQSHRSATSPPVFDHAPDDILDGPATARAYLGAVRRMIARMAEKAVDWREVIASLRPITPALWQRLPAVERARFLRHVRPYWESHRHRAAPQVARSIDQLCRAGALEIDAGRILSLAAGDDGIHIQYRSRSTGKIADAEVGGVVNCTGPTSDFRVAKEPLLMALDAAGMLKRDPLALGVEVDESLRVLDGSGTSQSFLYCVGPLLKARDWEATAVPELRQHVRAAAEIIVSNVRGRS